MYLDTLSLAHIVDGGTWVSVSLNNTGIAWDSDKNIKFRNPPGDLREALTNFAKPVAWDKPVYELDPNNSDNNG